MNEPAMNQYSLMARFNAWVNEQVYECASRLPEQAYRADRKAFFGSVHRTLNHLLVVDRLWTGRIEGVDRGIRALDQVLYDDFASLRAARRKEDEDLIALVDGLGEERLGAKVRFRAITDSGTYDARAGHILLTLFNHQTHHRGQVHALLTQAGITPPPLDLVVYLAEIGEVTRGD